MFDQTKTTQAAAQLLHCAGGTMNYMVLIKMLYLADRASLLKRGRPITWDKFKSMKYGPVLSKVHDLITEQADPEDPEIWKQYISDPCDWRVSLSDDPGEGKLSPNEKQFLNEAFEFCKPYLDRPFELAKVLHRDFPEVIEIEKGMQQPLPVKDILEANHVPDEEKDAILSDLAALRDLEGLLVTW